MIRRIFRPGFRYIFMAIGSLLGIMAFNLNAAMNPSTLPQMQVHTGSAPIYADLMRTANGLMSGTTQIWMNSLQLDSEGWVKTSFTTSTGIRVTYNPRIPLSDTSSLPGVYVLTWSGSGDIKLDGSSRQKTVLLTDLANKRMVVRIPSHQSPLVEIVSNDPNNTGDYLRNIKLWAPAVADAGSNLTSSSDLSPGKITGNLEPAPGQAEPFLHPIYENHMTSVKFGVLRTMGWNGINDVDSTKFRGATSWSNRRPVKYRNYQYNIQGSSDWPSLYTPNGSLQSISYEDQIDICNKFNLDYWVQVPHTASTTYTSELAKLIAGRLKSNLRVWFEFSNEIWNSAGPYAPQMNKALQAAALHFNKPVSQIGTMGTEHGWGAGKIQGDALKTFLDAWTSAGQSSSRAVLVLAGFQSGHSYNFEVMKSARAVQANLGDVFAVAHYWGADAHTKLINLAYGEGNPPASVFEEARKILEPFVYSDVTVTETVHKADSMNCPVVAYEGSHHVLAWGFSDNPKFVKFLRNLQYSTAMEWLHHAQWAYWKAQGAQTASSFVDVTWNGSSWGHWGFKEYYAQSFDQAPKWRALRDWCLKQEGIRNVGSPLNSAPSFTTTNDKLPIPEVGIPYNATVSTTAGDGAKQIILLGGGLPTGLTLTDNGNGTASIKGTPTQAASYWFTLRVIDADKDPAYKTYKVEVDPMGTSTNSLILFRGSDSPGGNYGNSADRRFDIRRIQNVTDRVYVPFGIGATDYWYEKEFNNKSGLITPTSQLNMYGGVSLSGVTANMWGGLRVGEYASWHGTNDGTKPSNYDGLFVWVKSQFTGAPTSAVSFGTVDKENTLLADITAFNGDNRMVRFVIQNGTTWYMSEASYTAEGRGRFQLIGFNNSSTVGKRWTTFTPKADSFAMPMSPSNFSAVNFNDVRAVGLYVHSERFGYNYSFNFNRFLAMGKSSLITSVNKVTPVAKIKSTFDYYNLSGKYIGNSNRVISKNITRSKGILISVQKDEKGKAIYKNIQNVK